MPNPGLSELRGNLMVLIAQLGQPDLTTDRGRLDYRALLLTQNALAILDLKELNPDAALFLYHLAGERIRELRGMSLLTDDQVKDLVGELVGLYGRFRPELLPRLLTPTTPPTE